MTTAKRILFVHGQGVTESGQELVRIYGNHRMWGNPVRVGKGTAALRYRAMYEQWRMKFQISYLKNMVTAEMLANLIALAGFIEGLCEWRPGCPKSNTGNFGRFEIKKGG
jgi:hypothetical protein